jgi:hypothetical protein
MTPVEQHDQFWNKAAVVATSYPCLVGLGAGVGFVCSEMMKPQSELLDKRRFLAGIGLSVFVGTATFYTLTGLGIPEHLAFGVAMLIGSTSKDGHRLLMKKAEALLEGAKK